MATGPKNQTAVTELTKSLQENSARLKQLDSQKRQLEMEIRRSVITAHHLDEVPDDAVMYKAVGKAYMMRPKSEILEDLQTTVSQHDQDIKQAKSSMDHLRKVQDGLLKELQEVK